MSTKTPTAPVSSPTGPARQKRKYETFAELEVQCPCCTEWFEMGIPLRPQVRRLKPQIQLRFKSQKRGRFDLTARASTDTKLDAAAEALGWRLGVVQPRVLQSEELSRLDQLTSLRRWMLGVLVTGSVFVSGVALWLATSAIRQAGKSEAMPAPAYVAEMAGTESLQAFLQAETVEDKLKHVIDAERIEGKLRAYYEKNKLDEGIDLSSLTPMPFLLSKADIERGIMCFAVRNKTDGIGSNFSIESTAFADAEINDVPSIEKPSGSKIGLGNELSPVFARSALAAIRTPLDGSPLFFTAKGKVDWETFIQHRNGSLRQFSRQPQAGRETFRAMVVRSPQTGVVMLYDLCHDQVDLAPIKARPGSLAERLFTDQLPAGKPRTVTLELEWDQSGTTPRLMCERIVCWEILGVGGREIPAENSPVVDTSSPSEFLQPNKPE